MQIASDSSSRVGHLGDSNARRGPRVRRARSIVGGGEPHQSRRRFSISGSRRKDSGSRYRPNGG